MNKKNVVFVVDDNSCVRNGLTRLLSAAGFDVKSFPSSREFLDAFYFPEVSGCLILNIGMPGIQDEELLDELNTRHPGLSIIVITADDNPEIRQQADRMKASEFFHKPVDGMALIDSIKWAMRSS